MVSRPPELAVEHQENTQAARVQRRRDFRLTFAPPTRYVPQPYENRFVDEDPGTDLTAQLLDLIENPQNAERLGAAHAEPS